MLKIYLSLLFPFFLLFAEENLPYMTSECDTYALVDGVVNAYNGKLIQIDQDIRTGGVDPLEMTRYYDGGHHFDSEFGYGVGCSYPALIQDMHDLKHVKVEIRQGLEVLCDIQRQKKLETKKNGHVYTGSLSKLYYKKGFTNCPTHLLQGEPSLFALQVHFDGQKTVVSLGDGTKRYCEGIAGPYFRLVKEELPSGNWRHFFYTSYDFPFSLKEICTTNRDGTLKLNWLNFKEIGDDTIVNASNGQQAIYKMQYKSTKVSKGNLIKGVTSGKIEKPLLFQATCDNYPPTEYESLKHTNSFQNLFSVFQVKSGQRKLKVDYDDKERVKTLKSAASAAPLYTFSYHSHHTDVVDANGAKKTYRFSDRRLESLTQAHRTLNFKWDDRGQLISHTIRAPDNAKYFEQIYSYDLKGNVIDTQVFGNITGCGSYECHHTQFLYDQMTNHLVSIKRNHDYESIFSYISGTGLVVNKLTFFKQRCVEREFYNYDKNGILILKVIDDGSGGDHSDFSDMTYRLITEIQPQLNPDLPGMTQPHLIKEFYVDIPSRQFHHLKTTEYLYTHGDLIAEKRIFDADEIHRYTLCFEYNERRELISETNALGEKTLYAFDDAGNKTYEEKLDSGKKIYFAYDLANRLIEEKEVHSDRHLVKNYSYDSMGNQLTQTDIYGRTTQKRYDHASREILSIDPVGYTEEKNYDIFGNITLRKDKDGYFIKTAHNIFGKPLEIVYPDGTVEWFAYNLEGHLIKEWKRDETILSHQLDHKARITKTDFHSKDGALLKTLQYLYKGPNLIGEIDALGNKTEYHFDGAGRKIAQIQGSQTTHYSYDSLGRLSKTLIEGLCCTCIEYDLLDRKIEERIEDLSGNISSKTQFEYDILGNQTVCRNFLDESNYSESRTIYNTQNLPIIEIDPLGFEKRTSYLQTDHLEKESQDSLGRRTTETYNALNQL